MNDMPYFRQNLINQNNLVLDKKLGDVNGDKINDTLYLLGSKAYNQSIMISNIHLVIQDGKNNQRFIINLKFNQGYNPRLFLGKFTNKDTNDILISIDSGNTGQEGFFYIYSFINNRPHKIFDFEDFNNKSRYSVTYKNNYIVEVINQNYNKKFSIDISNKDKEYLSQIYNENGNLKKPLIGMVSPINELLPIVSEAENNYDLYATQKVIGYYMADIIGVIITPLRWDKTEFKVIDNNPYLTIFGTQIDASKK